MLKFDLLSIINLDGIFNSLLLAVVLIMKNSGNRKANFILSLFIIDCILSSLFVVLYNTKLYYYLPHLIYIDRVFIFLLAPLVYFYVKALTQPSSVKFKAKELIHLAPFMLMTFHELPQFLESGEQKIQEVNMFLNHGAKLDFITYFLPVVMVQIICYLIYLLILIKRHETRIKETFSSIDRINLVWIKHFIIVFCLICFIMLPILILVPLGLNFYDIANLLPLSVYFSIFLIAFNAWAQPEIFFVNNRKKPKTTEKTNDKNQNDEESLVRLLAYMAKKKPYLDPNLSLLDLSKKLNISLMELMDVLNKHINKNYYDFINGFRIDEAKKLLIEPIGDDAGGSLSVYSKAGFDSKASFIKTFKNYTNMTPQQYRLKYFPQRSKDSCFTIGLFIDSFYSNYESIIFSGIQKLAIENGIRLITFSGGAIDAPHYSQTRKNAVFDLAVPESIDGLIIITSSLGHYITAEEFKRFCDSFHDIPVVSTGIEMKGYPSVVVDNYCGMQDLVTHLIEIHKYKKIALVRGPEYDMEAGIRFKAYRDTLEKFQIAVDDKLIIYGDYFGEVGKKAVITLIEERNVKFDVIIASNDLIALSIIQELGYKGIKVPEDIAVVGFDNIQESQYLVRLLTTVSQPLFDLGYQSLKTLLAVLYGRKFDEKIELPSRMIVRRTCGCSDPVFSEGGFVNVIGNSAGLNDDLDKFKGFFIPELENLLYKQFSDIIDEKLRSEWASKLIDSLVGDILILKEDKFITSLESIVLEVITNSRDSDIWNDVLLFIFNNVLSVLKTEKRIRFVNDLKIKAKSVIDNVGNMLSGYPMMRSKEKEFEFYIITQSLQTSFEIEKLSDIIMWNFPKLGIKSCYICLFQENEKNVSTRYSKVVIAYKNYATISYKEDESVFLTSQIVPGGVKNLAYDNPFIIMSLNFQMELLGFVLYEISNADREIFEILTIQTSNAVKSVLKYEHMKNQVEELKINSGGKLDNSG